MLHNCVLHATNNHDQLRSLFDKVCKLSTNFHMSPKQQDAFTSFHLRQYRQVPLQMITPVKTRWNYLIVATNRAMELLPALQAFVRDPIASFESPVIN